MYPPQRRRDLASIARHPLLCFACAILWCVGQGLDVAKGVSQGQVFVDKGKPHGKGFRVTHTQSGLDEFRHRIKEVEALAGATPTVIFESTGHYHTPIIQFLQEQIYLYILVNPLISHQARKSSLRKVKRGRSMRIGYVSPTTKRSSNH